MSRIARLSVLLMLITGLFSCSDSSNKSGAKTESDPAVLQIQSLEERMHNDSTFDRNSAQQLLQSYLTYYNQHGTDSLAIRYLYEAAKLSDALGKYDKAVELLTSYHDLVPDKEQKAEAAFLVGFIYDDHIKNPEKAIEYYNRVIELYPQSKWAEQSKSALNLVTMSDEELIRFLQDKNK